MTARCRVARPRTGSKPTRARRRRRYGITEPGTYSTIPVWWSRDRWRSECYCDLHATDVTELRREVGRRGPVSVAACRALARALSASADSDTGRNAMPGNAALSARPDTLQMDDPAVLARLQAATGYSLTTLQKAAQVLAARGWIVLVRAGKNWLTRNEREELRQAGSAARERRNVWACTIPRHLRAADQCDTGAALAASPNVTHRPREPRPVDNSTARNPDAESGCDLPTTRRVGGGSPVKENKIFNPQQASRTGAARPPGNAARSCCAYRADWRTVQLAKDIKARVFWLRDTSHQRIMSALDRFAKAGWSAADVLRELDRTLAARGWEVPSNCVSTTKTGREHRYPLRCPWGYLAMLLRTLEPTDLVAEREHARIMRAAQLDYEQLRRTGPECAHGEPAGDIPSPFKGVLACPLCRRGRGRAITTPAEQRPPFPDATTTAPTAPTCTDDGHAGSDASSAGQVMRMSR